MRKHILAAVCACLFTGQPLFGEYFADIRKQAASVEPKSAADYELGKKLLVEIKKLAATRKPALPRQHLVMETQTYRSARLWYTEKHWRDRQLFANRKFYDPANYSIESLMRSFGIMAESRIDVVNFFIDNVSRDRYYQAAAKGNFSPENFKLMPTLYMPGGRLPKTEYLRAAVNSPYAMRFQGRPLFLSYDGGRRPAEYIADYVKKLEAASGSKIALIMDFAGNGLGIYLDVYYNKGERVVPATILLRYFDRLLELLKVSDGIETGYYYADARRHLNYGFYDELLLPVYAAACAYGENNGNKLLCLVTVQGYTNMNGSQTLDSDGTKTLRGYLELAKKHNVDMICGFEWDELNENTNLEPTVAKPMANQRILKHHMDAVRKVPLTPRAGDDTTLPDLIVSSNRQLAMGQEFELELLNVPDGSSGSYTVAVELFDDQGKIWQSEAMKFDAAKLADRTIRLETEKYPASMFFQPELLITRDGKTRRISGLPPTALRGTVSIDYTWFSTPVRNLLVPEKSVVKFTEGVKLSPALRTVTAKADLRFSEPLNAVEIVQNSQSIYAYDPKNEYERNTPGKKLYQIAYRMINRYIELYYIVECPGAIRFNTAKADEPAFAEKSLSAKKIRLGRLCHNEYISIDAAQAANAVLTIRGTRLDGELAGQEFSWSVKLSDVDKYGISSKVFPDGLNFSVEPANKPHRLPLELLRNDVKFETALRAELPDGMLALRAVSDSGKIYWSRAYAPPASGKPVTVYTVSDWRGPISFTLPASRVTQFSYDFNTPETGEIITCDAGRDFYAHNGGFVSLATGFEGLIHGFTVPNLYGNNRGIAPEWITLPDGKRALKFNGKNTRGFFLPNTFVPSRNGFSATFDLQFDDVTRPQILWEQTHAASYLNGFRLRIADGKLVLEHQYHTPWKSVDASGKVDLRTAILVKAGVRQQITVTFDCRTISVSANGSTESIPAQGIGRWLSISAFGGRGNERFAGTLYGISVKHTK